MILAFSGIDGSGKTTVSQAVACELTGLGYPAEYSRPVYRANETVKEWCRRATGERFCYYPRIDPNFYLGIVVSDWLDWWFSTAEAATAAGRILCCDRYVVDTVALAHLYGANVECVRSMLAVIPEPNLSFLIQVPAGVADRRLDDRSSPPRHPLEGFEVLERTGHFLHREFEGMSRARVVDGSAPVAVVVHLCVKAFQRLLRADMKARMDAS